MCSFSKPELAQHLVNTIGDNIGNKVQVPSTTRLPARFNDKLATPKFDVQSLEQNVDLHGNKSTPTNSADNRHVSVRSSKSHIERLTESKQRDQQQQQRNEPLQLHFEQLQKQRDNQQCQQPIDVHY